MGKDVSYNALGKSKETASTKLIKKDFFEAGILQFKDI